MLTKREKYNYIIDAMDLLEQDIWDGDGDKAFKTAISQLRAEVQRNAQRKMSALVQIEREE